ncbi:MAG TPA: Zn-ribbon domain-containing OB-fold protein [Xanthobacteraceae bacterium]|nr:Zn-ribbon domain-containing OB-fold protein [Xanthobacteraceae bacterium]
MTRKITSPVVTVETQTFWNAARENRFMIPVCTACGKPHWYPRAICPFCASEKVEWREASGRGTIYTFSVMRRVKEPYVIAHVTLAEGPTMLTNLVDCDFDRLRIGQPVAVVFKETENGPPAPMFRPV